MVRARVKDLLKLVPDHVLQQIGNDMEVDKPNQKLTGERIFKVLLFSWQKQHELA